MSLREKKKKKKDEGAASSTPTPGTPEHDEKPHKDHKDSARKKELDDRRKALARKLCSGIISRSIEGIRDEYKAIKRSVDKSLAGEFYKPENMNKNRYTDVPCIDSTRVALTGEGTNYIHANYVASAFAPKRFICTQGPIAPCEKNPQGTTVDFWRMILQEEPEYIVMLCDVFENGMNKCDQYWPNTYMEVKQFGYASITNKEVTMIACEDAELRVCKLEVMHPYGSFIINHIQWLHWPDRGVPPPSKAPFLLLSVIRGSRKPIIVHCSAGIGRTGSIVMLEIVLEHLYAGKDVPSLPDMLDKIRSQRGQTIQTEHQYLYVYRSIILYFYEKRMCLTADKEYDRFCKEYDRFINQTGADKKAPVVSQPSEDDYFQPEAPRLSAETFGATELFNVEPAKPAAPAKEREKQPKSDPGTPAGTPKARKKPTRNNK